MLPLKDIEVSVGTSTLSRGLPTSNFIRLTHIPTNLFVERREVPPREMNQVKEELLQELWVHVTENARR